MRRAARLGDGWMPYLYSPRRYAESVETIRQVAGDDGRDLSDFEWFAYVFVNVHPDGDRARDEAARFLGDTYQTGDFQAMLERVAAVGTSDEVTATLQAFVDAGARHFILVPASREDSTQTVERLFGEVLPRLATP